MVCIPACPHLEQVSACPSSRRRACRPLFALVHLLHLFGHDGGHVGVVELKPALSLGQRGPGGGGTGR